MDDSLVNNKDVGLHCDKVTRAWVFLLGGDLHYGDFADPEEPLAAATARLTGRMAAAADLRPGLEVLDVGCGIGTPAVTVARRYGCHVTGISISEVGLEMARQSALERGVADRVRFLYGDGMSNGLPDASCDRVWVMESSHLMGDKAALLGECARVLRGGGKLVLCDIIAHVVFPIADIMRYGRDFLLLDQVFGRARMDTLEEYDRLAAAHGLHVTRLDDISREVRPTFAAWRRNAEAFRGEVESLLGREAVDQFVASTHVLEKLWDFRKLGYGMMVAGKS